ncbi:MAG: GNAT family N-acetyltransferase [Lachnospira sp.]
MIYEITDTTKVVPIFVGWEETLIYSCLQQVMGKIYVVDIENPKSACAFVGCFAFYAGEPSEELILAKPDSFVIMIPQNDAWAKMIEKCFPSAKKVIRYAMKKNNKFDINKLKDMVKLLPKGYELKKIDGDLYDKCLKNPETVDFVSSFENKDMYIKYGRGVVITRENEIVAGASSYTRYKEGIEIEVDTIESERRKHLATVACSTLILECLKEGLYPSWDAQNVNSMHLAEKLGYEFDHEYVAYEVC